MFTKNVAVTGFPFLLVDSAGVAITSGTVTGYVLKDGGTQTAIGGTPVHEGNGQWSVNLTASEMNADMIGLLFVHASASVHFPIRTRVPITALPTDSITADSLAADARTELLGSTAPAGWIDAAAIATDAITSTKLAADCIGASEVSAAAVTKIQAGLSTLAAADVWAAATRSLTDKAGFSLTQAFPANFASLGINASGHVSRVVLVDALTTYTGNTPQTGDLYGPIATMIETDGPLWRYTTNALEQAPTGGTAPTVVQIRQEIDTNSTQLAAIKAKTDNLPASPAAVGSPMVLSAAGFDLVPITAPSGPATTFRQVVIQTWMRQFYPSAKDNTAGTITTFAADGTTVVTTQDYTDDGAGNETLGLAE